MLNVFGKKLSHSPPALFVPHIIFGLLPVVSVSDRGQLDLPQSNLDLGKTVYHLSHPKALFNLLVIWSQTERVINATFDLLLR